MTHRKKKVRSIKIERKSNLSIKLQYKTGSDVMAIEKLLLDVIKFRAADLCRIRDKLKYILQKNGFSIMLIEDNEEKGDTILEFKIYGKNEKDNVKAQLDAVIYPKLRQSTVGPENIESADVRWEIKLCPKDENLLSRYRKNDICAI